MHKSPVKPHSRAKSTKSRHLSKKLRKPCLLSPPHYKSISTIPSKRLSKLNMIAHTPSLQTSPPRITSPLTTTTPSISTLSHFPRLSSLRTSKSTSHHNLVTKSPITAPSRAISVLNPRAPAPDSAVIKEMTKARPQSFLQRMTMLASILNRERKDRIRWDDWHEKRGIAFSADYAAEVFGIMQLALENPLSSYSFAVHTIAREGEDLQLPISLQLRKLRMAQNEAFQQAFAYLFDNGVSFPFSEEQIQHHVNYQYEFGMEPEVVLFLNKTMEILYGKKKTADSTKHSISPGFIHTLPQTYGVPAVNQDAASNQQSNDKNQPSQNASQTQQPQDQSHDGSHTDVLPVADLEIEEAHNTPESIANLRHWVKLHDEIAYHLCIHTDQLQFNALHGLALTVDQTKRILYRFHQVLMNPAVNKSIHQTLAKEVDPLGSFLPSEIKGWQNDRYNATVSAFHPHAIKVLQDDFKLKGDQVYTLLNHYVNHYQYDPGVQQLYHKYESVLRSFAQVPPDTPETRAAMAAEQLNRQKMVTKLKRKAKVESELARGVRREDIRFSPDEECSDSDDAGQGQLVGMDQDGTQQGVRSSTKSNKFAKAQPYSTDLLPGAPKPKQSKDDPIDQYIADSVQMENLRLIYGSSKKVKEKLSSQPNPIPDSSPPSANLHGESTAPTVDLADLGQVKDASQSQVDQLNVKNAHTQAPTTNTTPTGNISAAAMKVFAEQQQNHANLTSNTDSPSPTQPTQSQSSTRQIPPPKPRTQPFHPQHRKR